MRTNKTSTVTLLKENHRQWQSKDLMYIHYLEFKNGDKGEYFSKYQKCSEFSLNEFVEYSIEQKGFLGNKPVFRVNPVNKAEGGSNTAPQRQSNGGGGDKRAPFNNNGSSKPQRNENAIMSQHAITKSVELISCGAIGVDNLYPKALEILQWTHKLGNMSVEEILALPVEFIAGEIEKEKPARKRILRARTVPASDKSKLF